MTTDPADFRDRALQGLLAQALRTAGDSSATPADRNTATRLATRLLEQQRLEQERAREQAERDLARSQLVERAETVDARDSGAELTERAFLVRQIAETEEDLEDCRHDPAGRRTAVALHRRQLVALRKRLAEMDAVQEARDPYDGMSTQEVVEALRTDILPRLHDEVLLACIREYGTRYGARVTLTRLEDGSQVQLQPDGAWG